MRIAPVEASELPALAAFFREVGASVARENIDQFSMPRGDSSCPSVGALVMKDGDRIIGSIGYIDLPLRISRGGARAGDTFREETSRWPINQFLLAEWRGRGLGKQMMDAVWEGASCLLVIGGTKSSTPSREGSGWRLMGNLACWRFRAPLHRLLAAGKLKDRRRAGVRRFPSDTVSLRVGARDVQARRTSSVSGWLPWVGPDPAGGAVEIGVPRDAAYLQFAFFGALSAYHVMYTVSVDGAVAGFFVLAARADRPPALFVEIVDLDAVPGREADVIEAARATAFTRGDIVRLRLCGDRFTRALQAMRGDVKQSPDHAFRVLARPGSLALDAAAASLTSWRLTYGDHDQYRVRTKSRPWSVT